MYQDKQNARDLDLWRSAVVLALDKDAGKVVQSDPSTVGVGVAGVWGGLHLPFTNFPGCLIQSAHFQKAQ